MEPAIAAGPDAAGRDNAPLDRLGEAIEHAAHLLPAQGPIDVFIHHNTLHAFEDLSFDQAVRRGGETFGCEPYLPESRYRAELNRGRIRFDDLREVLREDLGSRADDSLLGLGSRMDLRLAVLQHPAWSGPVAELLWLLTEGDVLRRVRPGTSAFARGRLLTETRRWVMRDLRGRRGAWAAELLGRFESWRIESWDESEWESFSLHLLWRVCRDGLRTVPAPSPSVRAGVRHRDLLREATGEDVDCLVNDLLIRVCAAFLDQGVSHWTLPERERGLYQSFLSLFRQPGGPPDEWLRGLSGEAARLQDAGTTPLEAIEQSLAALGVTEEEYDDFLSQTLLALRGWAGMIRQAELRGDSVAHPVPAGSLVEYLAVRLLLTRLALAYVAKQELNFTGSLSALRDALQERIAARPARTVEQRAYPLFRLAQVLGWSPEELHRLTPAEWSLLVNEVESFPEIERRRVFHLAYERRFRNQSLDALVLHPYHHPSPARPRFQVITCLDEREESFRRHLEEIAPDLETFSTAGFFGIATYYRGVDDARFVPLCPIVVKPGHWITEQVCDGHEYAHQKQTRLRRVIGATMHGFHVGTRSLALGAALTAGLGALAAVPLVAQTLFPRLAARLGRSLARFFRTPTTTRLKLERTVAAPGDSEEGQGYVVEEMTAIAEKVLREMGLTRRFARLIFVLGHGSDSPNNPHKSAYDCGACGGNPGAPNGRAMAQMLNDPRVRQGLAARGLAIPEDTWFVGGFHNTCDDSVAFFDLDAVPESHRTELDRARGEMEQTCERNAHERCRRFMSARLDLTPAEARRHVQARSDDLAQPRPELGHATNALCLVGRRERTRGLYLDRRAFLTSYDPTQDDADGTILARILAAAVPVCAGINLEYYFSHVDNQGYGCGSKLPHNVTSLLGVMDGAASDLRTGLPWQMVEIHEPIRLLFVVETTPQIMLSIMNRNPVIGTLVRNGWVQMAVQDPASGEVRLFTPRAGEPVTAESFVPHRPQTVQLPVAPSSADWYRGWRDHLEFAEIVN